MVKPDSALRRLMRETGKLLQPYGFEGAEPTWTCVLPDGVATVARSRTFRTFTAGQQVLSFGFGCWGTPLAWWEFHTWRTERMGLAPTPIESAPALGLLPDDALPEDPATLWSVRVDQGHVFPEDIDTIRAELPRRIHTCARRALRLADPANYLEELLSQPNPTPAAQEAIIVLLAQRGPTPELDAALTAYLSTTPAPAAQALADYARTRTTAAV
ncbi:hypothetical protein D7D52_00230 [Nocardia yunnanensis]|uniref:DUF4304 domain-containing protein n=1 Tax=Nocardia yunnanensis TaxID=2382165 RepID=A0A386Z4T6_9NOCA|nr:hypothetical protein [Nocardia yunnanensis]AYF72566.1 hypothetical protein D7D52_00230 [Nocardia yunnanensis]